MTQRNNLSTQPIHPASLAIHIIVGAMIGLLVISFFVFSADHPDPAWGKYWMVRPLIITPLAGATGGLCNYLLVHYHHRVGIHKTVAMLLSVIVFMVGLWMGIVLGLDGTMWD